MYKTAKQMDISANQLDISQFSMYNKEKQERENGICINLRFPTSES